MPFIRSMQILIVIVIICIAIAGAFALGLYYGKNTSTVADQSQVPTAQDQVQQVLEQAIEESGVVTGKLVAVNGQELTIDAQMPILNPLQAPATKQRIVTVTSDTKITKRTAKPAEEIQKSQEDFVQSLIKNTATSTASITAPITYTETPATMADLTTGSTLSINTIKDGDTYIATTVAIN